MEVRLHVFFSSALDGDEWWASCSAALHPGKESPVLTWIRDRVDIRTGLDIIIIIIMLLGTLLQLLTPVNLSAYK
jgi:hypothetical protein